MTRSGRIMAALTLLLAMQFIPFAGAQEPGDPRGWTPVDWRLVREADEKDRQSGEEEEETTGPRGEKGADVIVTDRPDFTEASSTVPAGMTQLESGYTFFMDDESGVRTFTHTFPEWLLRVGLFKDFELRFGWFYVVESEKDRPAATRTTMDGGADMYLGVKIGISEQHGLWPEMATNIQGTVPTGAAAFSAKQVNAGFNHLYGWDVNDFLSIGASTGLNSATEDTFEVFEVPHPTIPDSVIEQQFPGRDSHLIFHQSVTIGYQFTEKLGAYTEWFTIAPLQAEDNAPQNYFDGGITFKVTRNLQLDIRAGWGLNKVSTDFFGGAGYSVRF